MRYSEMGLFMKTPLKSSSTQSVDRTQPARESHVGPPAPLRYAKSSAAELPDPCKKALTLWLQWNDAYEQVVGEMFKPGQDQRSLEDLMDRMDQLRRDAIELSRDLLD